VASGLSEIIVVTGRGKRAIEDHFDAAFELEYYLNDRGKVEELAQIKTISELASVSYVRQKEPLGLGHAILCARSLVGDEPFAVFLGDDIIGAAPSPCMRQLLDVCERRQGPAIAVQRVPREHIHQYGVVSARQLEARVHEVLDLVEKPKAQDAPSDLAIIGRYVLPPEIFAILAETRADSRGEIQLTDALRELRRRRPMYAVEFEGRRYDTGDKLGFLKATVEFALARPDLAGDFRAYLKSLGL
jgi:UTP--glucose-1-phosphate uridylyltransferase